MKPFILSLLAMALWLSSCHSAIDEELLTAEAPLPMRLALAADTRAPVSSITAANVSSVGLFAATEGSTSGQFPWTAAPFAANLVPSGISGTQLTFATPLYYPPGGKRVKFYGYYPRTTNSSGTTSITAPSTGVAPVYNFVVTGDVDIMHAVATPSGSNSPATIAFTFNHKLTQIQLNVSILGALLTGIKLLAVKTNGSMNVETGVVTYSASPTSDILFTIPLLSETTNPMMVPSDVANYTVEASLTGLVPIRRFTIAPTTGVFKAGVVYNINL